MGGFSGLLGTAGGAAGTGFAGPQKANIQETTNTQNVNQAQAGANNALGSQQSLLNALSGQNAIGNQGTALTNQMSLANQLGAANGVGQQQQALSSQDALVAALSGANGVGAQQSAISGLQGIGGQQANTSQLYQNIATGQGPNLAQSMLNQATGQNVANQAALMAGQRGAGSNVGLLARQAGQQGAALQQQAVGQGASQQAAQQINALSGLTAAQQAQAQTQQAIGGLGQGLTGEQQAAIGQQAAQAQALTGQQMAAQQAAANQANTMAGQQIGAVQTGNQANLANAGQQQGALGALNQANVSSQGNVNTANAGLAAKNMEGQQGLIGGGLNAAGAALAAKGGLIQKMADGGTASLPQQSSFGDFLKNWGSGIKPTSDSSQDQASMSDLGSKQLNKGMTNFGAGIASSLKSKPEAPIGNLAGPDAPQMMPNMTAGPMLSAKGGLAKNGGHVAAKKPAQKAEKSGNDYDNDKVPAMLSEGEIVLPRTVTMSKDPARSAAEFVRKTLAKKRVAS